MEIKRYYIADLSFALSKFNICVCRPFEQDNKIYVDIWHPVTQCYCGQHNLTRDRQRFFSSICADFYSLEEAFSAVNDYKAPLFSKGKFTGYKILRHDRYSNAYLLGILEIPDHAKRIAPYFSDKMRADYVLVKDILRLIPYRRSFCTVEHDEDFGLSPFSPRQTLRYTRDCWVRADSLDEDRTMVATHGIHFYLTKEEAINSLKQRLRQA